MIIYLVFAGFGEIRFRTFAFFTLEMKKISLCYLIFVVDKTQENEENNTWVLLDYN